MTHDRQTTLKTTYARPELTVFGSVRNLTGGSNGSVGDGGSMVRMNMR